MLSILSGHRRYARITSLRCDRVNPPLLGMKKVLSEDAARRGTQKIEETRGLEQIPFAFERERVKMLAKTMS